MSAPLFFEVPRQEVLRLKNYVSMHFDNGVLVCAIVRRGLAVADNSVLPGRGAEAALVASFREASEVLRLAS